MEGLIPSLPSKEYCTALGEQNKPECGQPLCTKCGSLLLSCCNYHPICNQTEHLILVSKGFFNFSELLLSLKTFYYIITSQNKHKISIPSKQTIRVFKNDVL